MIATANQNKTEIPQVPAEPQRKKQADLLKRGKTSSAFSTNLNAKQDKTKLTPDPFQQSVDINYFFLLCFFRAYLLDAFTQCGTTPCLRYIIEAIRDYNQVKAEHMAYLLNGISAARNPAPYLFDEMIVSDFSFFLYLNREDFFIAPWSSSTALTLKNLVFTWFCLYILSLERFNLPTFVSL